MALAGHLCAIETCAGLTCDDHLPASVRLYRHCLRLTGNADTLLGAERKGEKPEPRWHYRTQAVDAVRAAGTVEIDRPKRRLAGRSMPGEGGAAAARRARAAVPLGVDIGSWSARGRKEGRGGFVGRG